MYMLSDNHAQVYELTKKFMEENDPTQITNLDNSRIVN